MMMMMTRLDTFSTPTKLQCMWCGRALSCQWVLLNVQITTQLFTFTVQKCIYPSVIIRMTILKEPVNGPLPKSKRGGANRSTRRNHPTTSSKISITLLEAKIHPLTLVISSLGQNAPALSTELLLAANWTTGCHQLFSWWTGGLQLQILHANCSAL